MGLDAGATHLQRLKNCKPGLRRAERLTLCGTAAMSAADRATKRVTPTIAWKWKVEKRTQIKVDVVRR